MWREITEKEREQFNDFATHPLQSFEWGEFRQKTGIKVIREGAFENNKIIQAFQMTIHKIPHSPFTIGYIPKGKMPTREVIEELKRIGREEKCIFIQLEPNKPLTHQDVVTNAVENDDTILLKNLGLLPSAHPLFTRYTFVLDLEKSEEDLLEKMHPKTRYNIKVAQKHNVTVKEETSEKAFESYLDLTKETTSRQGFFAHTPSYHKKMWETLHSFVIASEQSERGNPKKKKEIASSQAPRNDTSRLTAHLLVAYYDNQPLTTWILFVFHDTLYYPYGASSNLHREVMASNLQMWEAIKFGKKLKLKKFDMWGALGEKPSSKDPWYGFHRFKQGYGPELVEFVGSYDLVINPILYLGYKLADKLRGIYLKVLN